MNENMKNKIIDPMIADSKEEADHKKRIWAEIYLRCPQFADALIKVYDTDGTSGIDGLIEDYERYVSIFNIIVGDVEDTASEEGCITEEDILHETPDIHAVSDADADDDDCVE